MEFLGSLLQGYTPILLFILICFAALLVMFYRVVRSLDDVVQAVSQDREALKEAVDRIAVQMDQLVQGQAQSNAVLHKLAQKPANLQQQPAWQHHAPPLEQTEPTRDHAAARGAATASGAAMAGAGAAAFVAAEAGADAQEQERESLNPPSFETPDMHDLPDVDLEEDAAGDDVAAGVSMDDLATPYDADERSGDAVSAPQSSLAMEEDDELAVDFSMEDEDEEEQAELSLEPEHDDTPIQAAEPLQAADEEDEDEDEDLGLTLLMDDDADGHDVDKDAAALGLNVGARAPAPAQSDAQEEDEELNLLEIGLGEEDEQTPPAASRTARAEAASTEEDAGDYTVEDFSLDMEDMEDMEDMADMDEEADEAEAQDIDLAQPPAEDETPAPAMSEARGVDQDVSEDVSEDESEDVDLVFHLDDEESGEAEDIQFSPEPPEPPEPMEGDMDFGLEASEQPEDMEAEPETEPEIQLTGEAEQDDDEDVVLLQEPLVDAELEEEALEAPAPEEVDEDIPLFFEEDEEEPGHAAEPTQAAAEMSEAPDAGDAGDAVDLLPQSWPEAEADEGEVELLVDDEEQAAAPQAPPHVQDRDARAATAAEPDVDEDMFSDSLGIVPDFEEEAKAPAAKAPWSDDEVQIVAPEDEKEAPELGEPDEEEHGGGSGLDMKVTMDEAMLDAMNQDSELEVAPEPDETQEIDLDILAEEEQGEPAGAREEHKPEFTLDDAGGDDESITFSFDEQQDEQQEASPAVNAPSGGETPATAASRTSEQASAEVQDAFEDEPAEQHVDIAKTDEDDQDLDMLIERLSAVDIDEDHPDDETPDFETELVLDGGDEEEEDDEPETELDIPSMRRQPPPAPPESISMDEEDDGGDEDEQTSQSSAPASGAAASPEPPEPPELGADDADEDFSLDDLGVVLEDDEKDDRVPGAFHEDDDDLDSLLHDVVDASDQDEDDFALIPGQSARQSPHDDEDDLLTLADMELEEDEGAAFGELEADAGDQYAATQSEESLDNMLSLEHDEPGQGGQDVQDLQAREQPQGKARATPPRQQQQEPDDDDLDIELVIEDDET